MVYLSFSPFVLSPAIPHLPPPQHPICWSQRKHWPSLQMPSSSFTCFLPRNAPYPGGSIRVLGFGHVFRVSRQGDIWGLLSSVHVPLLEAMCFFLSLCYPPKRDTAKRIWVVIWGGGSPKQHCEGVGVWVRERMEGSAGWIGKITVGSGDSVPWEHDEKWCGISLIMVQLQVS